MKFFIRFTLILSLFLGNFETFAQTIPKDSAKFIQVIPKDSVAVNNNVPEHSPQKATRLSALCPGLGQIYNRKYWKVPVVYGTFATLGYFIGWNNLWFHRYKRAYFDLVNGNTNGYYKVLVLKVSPNFDFSNPENISFLTERFQLGEEYYRRNRDLCIILSAVWYAFQIVDANVDGHLIDFDISDKLSFNFKPFTAPMGEYNSRQYIGLQCNITF